MVLSLDLDRCNELKEVIDSIPYYVLIINSEHEIIMANRSSLESLQMNMEDVTGEYCPKIVHNIKEEFKPCPLKKTILSGNGETSVYYDRKKQRWLSLEIYPMDMEFNGKKLFFHFVRDISEKKNYLERMERENHTGKFYLDIMIHDISNIIQPLIGYLEIVKELPEIKEKYSGLIKTPIREALKLSDLIKKVKTISILETQPVDLIKVDVNHEIHIVFEKLIRIIPDKRIEIEYSASSNIGQIDINQSIIEPITNMFNFLLIHMKTSKAKLRINCNLNKDENKLLLSVNIGEMNYSRNELHHFFERYNNGIFKEGLIGYKIAFSQEIIKRLGGNTYLQFNEDNDTDTTIIIEIPTYRSYENASPDPVISL